MLIPSNNAYTTREKTLQIFTYRSRMISKVFYFENETFKFSFNFLFVTFFFHSNVLRCLNFWVVMQICFGLVVANESAKICMIDSSVLVRDC